MTVGLLQDRLVRVARQGERAVTGAVRAWAGAVSQVAGAVPDPDTVLRSAFELTEQVLRAQWEAARDVVRLVSPRGR